MDFNRSSTPATRFTCNPASSAFKSAVEASPAGASPCAPRLLSITSMDFTRASTAAARFTCNTASSAFKCAVVGSSAGDSLPASRLLNIISMEFKRASAAATARFTCSPASSACKSAVDGSPARGSPRASRLLSITSMDFTRCSSVVVNPVSVAETLSMASPTRPRTTELSVRVIPFTVVDVEKTFLNLPQRDRAGVARELVPEEAKEVFDNELGRDGLGERR